MDNHPGKMKVYQIEKNAVEWKLIKFQIKNQKSKIKKEKEKRAR